MTLAAIMLGRHVVGVFTRHDKTVVTDRTVTDDAVVIVLCTGKRSRVMTGRTILGDGNMVT